MQGGQHFQSMPPTQVPVGCPPSCVTKLVLALQLSSHLHLPLSHLLESLAKRLSSRAQSCWFYGHPAVQSEVLSHPSVVASGVSALSHHHVDLVVSEQSEAYVPESRVPELADRFALDADSDRPNFRLRVVSDDDWPFEVGQREASAPVVAVDLLESDDERWKWRHGIAKRRTDTWNGQKIARQRRVSITFRTIARPESAQT